jgi:lipopolysaccharide cholinephosphotransferase
MGHDKGGRMLPYTDGELRSMQEICLEMAKYFVEFCTEHNLLCYFCGGGCIGAIRNHGFIPWDDDLDFFMPREDYEKLKVLWGQEQHQNSRLCLLYPSKDYNDYNSFITLRDCSTTFIKPYQKSLDITHGILIDIFPLDGCPSSKHKRFFQKIWACIYLLFCSQQVPQKHGKALRTSGKLLLAMIPRYKTRYKIWHFAEKKMSRYAISECSLITELCAGPYYMKKEYPKDIFAAAVYKDFEDTKMPVPVGYDTYLKIAFGDYMKLPPKEKQVPEHDCDFLDLRTPYDKYKGIYYCLEKKR